jgi:hypothetical protein
VTRYGRADTRFSLDYRQLGVFSDLVLGTRRSRAAILLLLALPGSAYIYQGEELGLYEVEDIPDELRQDPMFWQTNGANPGRDGCRVPLPWSGDEPSFAFSPPDATTAPWLPQPAAWREYTVDAEQGDPGSMLELYREALRLHRIEPALGDGPLTWLDSAPHVLAFARGDGFTCLVNLSAEPVALPAGELVLAPSHPTPPPGSTLSTKDRWPRVCPAGRRSSRGLEVRAPHARRIAAPCVQGHPIGAPRRDRLAGPAQPRDAVRRHMAGSTGVTAPSQPGPRPSRC